ncbi:hypothetical protein MC28_D056 (plasmid) [Bacillus thuringiensis MC28]|uniref:hypothetical protein n=1 Tax=Bacillus cereus TaxID=1396 RepID=UPI00028BABDE|nr:hypothetical protein [Bacillus cereus]AFU17105.1 hypothetical protein MC28_D056 [Bacillus thuringiensis MC28]
MGIEGLNQIYTIIGISGMVISFSFGFLVIKNRLDKFDEYSENITGKDVDKVVSHLKNNNLKSCVVSQSRRGINISNGNQK